MYILEWYTDMGEIWWTIYIHNEWSVMWMALPVCKGSMGKCFLTLHHHGYWLILAISSHCLPSHTFILTQVTSAFPRHSACFGHACLVCAVTWRNQYPWWSFVVVQTTYYLFLFLASMCSLVKYFRSLITWHYNHCNELPFCLSM